jgi:4,4'-diaponeurosporenoate glycosyltransferase
VVALGVVVVVVGLALATLLVARVPRLGAARVTATGRRVLVVVPARDEADVLGDLLDDLAAQTRPAQRVVVVDDGSRDATASVAARPGVEVRPATTRPPGWNPKTWALTRGLSGADEDVVVFLDADVRLAPEALGAVLGALERRGGVITVAPRHDVVTPVESLSLPFNLVAVMGAGAGWTGRDPSARGAFGPCIAVERLGYESFGGHAADPADLLDDLALARRARSAGTPVALYRGGPLVRYRMYRSGARGVLDGWTKNIAAGATRTVPGTALGVATWVTASLSPLVWLATARSLGALALAAAAWGVVAAHTAFLARRVGRFPRWSAAVAPLLAVVFVTVVARSAAALALGRPVRWKGRDLVATRGGPADG